MKLPRQTIKRDVVILTGLSGAGKTTALQALEDLGFYCVDNLPFQLIPDLLSLWERSRKASAQHLAFGVDARREDFLKDPAGFLKKLKASCRTRVVYLESRPQVLIHRYRTSRRPHPLGRGRGIPENIRQEEKILAPMKELADKIIDTSEMNVHELKELLKAYFHFLIPSKKLGVTLMSFGYKYGIPVHADLVLDVRFLRNPYFDEKLKRLTGRTKSVQKFVESDRAYTSFVKKTQSLLGFLLKAYTREGKSNLNIAFGCTGGRHRSVVMAEKFQKVISNWKYGVVLLHRDIKRDLKI